MTWSALESRVLEAFVSGTHPFLGTLRAQIGAARVRARETSPHGFLTDLWIDDSAPQLTAQDRFALDDVFGRVRGVEEDVCFLLHVVRGRAKTLEGFVAAGTWPAEPALVQLWYVAPDPAAAGQLSQVAERDLGFALRGAETPDQP